MNITTREAQLSDVPEVAELFDLYRQFYEQPPNPEVARKFITDRLTKRESVIILAVCDQNGPVGFCQLYSIFCSIQAMPIYSLSDLFVMPTARKAGVGRMLLEAAKFRAEADGKAHMELTTAKTNHAAQSLYESLGWVRDSVYFAYSITTRRTVPTVPA
jgi:ribosomal protein S18 acetylase RimI-like enzyme